MKYWFLSEPFQQDAVFSRLTTMQFRYVVGMDVGHGETLVYLLDTQQMQLKKLYIMDNEDKIPTMMAFRQDGSVVIGKAAGKYPGFIQDFKVDPGQWGDLFSDETANGEQSGAKRTYEDLMKIFIREVWKGVLQKNPKLEEAVQNNQVLITVGCPSSPLWTDTEPVRAYQKLIVEATGCPHAAVLAESTAAIMSVILDKYEVDETAGPETDTEEEKTGVCLSRGLAVIDAGSSTIDFTYVLLGRKLITASLRIAGYSIDEQMLEQALEDSGLTRDQIPAEQEADILVQLRGIKEDFYPDQTSLGTKSIHIWGRNDRGEVDKDVYSGLCLTFAANQEFMNKVLDRGIRQSHLSAATSWRKACREFIRDCWALIARDENGELLCDKVILTGGTSHVPVIYEAAAENYSRERVSYSRDCSASVAKGLGYAKALEIRGCGALGAYRESAEKLTEENYGAFLQELAEYMAEEVCENIQNIICRYVAKREKITVGKLLDKIKLSIYTNKRLTGTDCRDKVEELFVKHFETAQNQLHEKVNEVSRQIYGAKLDQIPEIPQLTAEELRQITQQLNISVAISGIWQKILSDGFHLSVISSLISFLGMALMQDWIAGGAFGYVVDKVKKGAEQSLLKKASIPGWVMDGIYNSVRNVNTRQKIIKTAAKDTVQSMKKKELMKDIFVSYIAEQTEVLLGKVMFLVYEEEPAVR